MTFPLSEFTVYQNLWLPACLKLHISVLVGLVTGNFKKCLSCFTYIVCATPIFLTSHSDWINDDTLLMICFYSLLKILQTEKRLNELRKHWSPAIFAPRKLRRMSNWILIVLQRIFWWIIIKVNFIDNFSLILIIITVGEDNLCTNTLQYH